jgi:hypothetical protein
MLQRNRMLKYNVGLIQFPKFQYIFKHSSINCHFILLPAFQAATFQQIKVLHIVTHVAIDGGRRLDWRMDIDHL